MSNVVWKNFHLWFSKLRCLPTVKPPSSPLAGASSAKNFDNSDHYSTTSTAEDYFFSSLSDDSTTDSDTVPDLSAVFASHRFFFSSPGCSNSIVESPDTRPDSDKSSVGDGVEVRKFSLDPYVDFRNSMQEMVEARDEWMDVKSDWQYLQELLLCYLQLNPIDTHKFILSAFSDLVIYLLETSESACGGVIRHSGLNQSGGEAKQLLAAVSI